MRIPSYAAIAALIGAVVAGPSGSGGAQAQSLSVDAIVHRANLVSYYQGRDGRAQVAMTITDSQGRTRERSLTILRRDEAQSDALQDSAYYAGQKYYVFFQRPADVNKTVFLVWKNLEREDDRWLYLPALDLVKRIAASDKRTSFVGSDFFYEDVSGRGVGEDAHELVETTDNYFVLRNTPKEPEAVEFSYYTIFIHKQTFLPVQSEYFDKAGKKYRVYRALKVETIQGRPTVTQASMENVQTGSKTVVTYSDVRYDAGLPEEIFNERFLRRPPLKYLR